MRAVLVLATVACAACATATQGPDALVNQLASGQVSAESRVDSSGIDRMPPYQALDYLAICTLGNCPDAADRIERALTKRYADQYTESVSSDAARMSLVEGVGRYHLSRTEYGAVRLLALLGHLNDDMLGPESRRIALDIEFARARNDTVAVAALAPAAWLAGRAASRADADLARVLRLQADSAGVTTSSSGLSEGVLVVLVVDLVPALEQRATDVTWADNSGVVHSLRVAAPFIPLIQAAPGSCSVESHGESVPLDLIADFAGLRTRELNADLPSIAARSLLRSAGHAAASDQLGRSVAGPQSIGLRSLINLTSKSLDRADLRGPTMMPRLLYAGVVSDPIDAVVRCPDWLGDRALPSSGASDARVIYSIRTALGSVASGIVSR